MPQAVQLTCFTTCAVKYKEIQTERCMHISLFALNYLRGESLHWPVFVSSSASLCGAEEKCFRGLRNMRWEWKRNWRVGKWQNYNVFCVPTCKCLFALKREDSSTECAGRGGPSYFLLNSCVCLWKGGGREKKREGTDMIFSHYPTCFYLTHGCMDSDGQLSSFLLLVYCLSGNSVKCLCQSCLSPCGWVTSTPLLLVSLLAFLLVE